MKILVEFQRSRSRFSWESPVFLFFFSRSRLDQSLNFFHRQGRSRDMTNTRTAKETAKEVVPVELTIRCLVLIVL